MLGDARDREGPHRAHRARQRLGRRRGRRGLARRRQELHLGERAGRVDATSTSCPATGRRSGWSPRATFDVARRRRAIDEQGRLALLHRVARQPDPALSLPRPGSTARASRERLSPAERAGDPRLRPSPGLPMGDRHLLALSRRRRSSELVRLPGHQVIRTLVDNAGLTDTRRRHPARTRPSGSSVPSEDGAKMLDGVLHEAGRISTRPRSIRCCSSCTAGRAAQTVEDALGRSTTSGTLMLTQQGYLVAVRGQPRHTGARSAAPGARRSTASSACVETRDQAAAARELRRRPYVDPARIGIWGWSYGGFMSLNVALPASRHLPDGGRRLAGDELEALRQRLHRAVQRPASPTTRRATSAARRSPTSRG